MMDVLLDLVGVSGGAEDGIGVGGWDIVPVVWEWVVGEKKRAGVVLVVYAFVGS